ncbi:hypothetical protein [Escherichia coli ISC7]|uniref:Uncharacterized protein n=1 Tax=Escherichia coli ISC7 TaxID=1432555 RepID=W1F1K6_ECOLX|nr:hypothetical protein [Escherichia coli ISC7]
MNTANQMKMAIAGKGDIDGRPGVMITAQRGPKRFLPGTTDPYDLPL